MLRVEWMRHPLLIMSFNMTGTEYAELVWPKALRCDPGYVEYIPTAQLMKRNSGLL